MNNPSPPHDAPTYPPPEPKAAVYPIPRPAGGDDARFTVGLALDVTQVLARHGYPALANDADLIHWQQTLFAGIYTTPGKEITA